MKKTDEKKSKDVIKAEKNAMTKLFGYAAIIIVLSLLLGIELGIIILYLFFAH